MSTNGITIPIRAIADVSGVSSAFNRLFSGQGARALKDYQRDMDRLHASLTATGQAGKNINRVLFDPSANQAELRTLTRIRQEMEAIARTKQGRQWRASVIGSGQDWNKPWTWDYGRMGSHGAALQQRMAGQAEGSALSSLGSWGMGQARQGLGTVASLAGIGSMIGAVVTGYREHLATLEGVDTVFKSIGSSNGFAGLMDDTRALGKALQMTGSEASHLIQRFAQASGAISASSAFGQAQFAGQFGRGVGINPNASADLMARSSLVGYGNTKQSQRDFAATIGQTIAGSGMQARSEQVMGALVAHIEKIATNQGRTAGTAEVGNYADMLRTLLKDPALRGGGADTVLQIGKQLGGEGGPMAEAVAAMAYGPAVNNRLDDILRIQQADENTPLDKIPGLGPVAEGYGDKTRRELAMKAADTFAQGTPWSSSYVISKMFGIGTIQQNDVYKAGLQDTQRQQEVRKTGGYRDWMKGEVGTDYQEANPTGFGITTDVYENRGKLDKAHLDRLTGLANEYTKGDLLEGDKNQDLKAELKKAMEDGGTAEERMPQLQLAIAKIAARVGEPKTKADETRESAANLVNLLAEMGDVVGTTTNALRNFATTVLGITLPGGGGAAEVAGVMSPEDNVEWGNLQNKGYIDQLGNLTGKPFETLSDSKKYYEILERRKNGTSIGANGVVGSGSGGGSSSGPWKASWADQVPNNGAPKADGGKSGGGGYDSGSGGEAKGEWSASWSKEVPNNGAPKANGSGEWSEYLRQLEEERGLPPGILAGTEYAETGAMKESERSTAVSKSGALGRFQFMPKTAKRFNLKDPTNDRDAARAAADYHAANTKYLKKHGVDPSITNLAAAYNAGEGSVVASRGVPPKAETRVYAPKVAKEAERVAGLAKAPAPDLAPSVSEANEDKFTGDGLNIRYAGSDRAPYGVKATENAEPFKGIVMHHATGKLDNLVNYGKSVDKQRGGSFGYHYYVGEDGQIVQGAPMSKRTNHVKPGNAVGLNNSNSIGISLINAEKGGTPGQLAAANKLAEQLQGRYGLDPRMIFGHGEIQNDKMATEGREVAEPRRNAAIAATKHPAGKPGEAVAGNPVVPVAPVVAKDIAPASPAETTVAPAAASTAPEAPAEVATSSIPVVPVDTPTGPEAPVAAKPVTAPPPPVVDTPNGAPSASGRTTTGFNGRDTQPRMPASDDPRFTQDALDAKAKAENISTEDAWKKQWAEIQKKDAETPKPPPVPIAAVTNINGPVASANVNGQVGININVARDGRPVESSAHQLSFGGEPRVFGSGGSQQSRVEWSRTV